MGVCLDPPTIITQYCKRGSLHAALSAAPHELDWGLRLRIAAEAARALEFLHGSSPPVLHRDVKSPNILLDDHRHAKLCDLGLAKIMDAGAAETRAEMGTMQRVNPRWLAPELLRAGVAASAASDVFALGMTMLELATDALPWGALHDAEVMIPNQRRNRSPTDRCSPASVSLCLCPRRSWACCTRGGAQTCRGRRGAHRPPAWPPSRASCDGAGARSPRPGRR